MRRITSANLATASATHICCLYGRKRPPILIGRVSVVPTSMFENRQNPGTRLVSLFAFVTAARFRAAVTTPMAL